MKVFEAMVLRMMNSMLANYDRSGPFKKRLVSIFMHHFPGQITCKEFGGFIAEYFEGTLPERTRRRFEFHLRGCPMCRNYLNEYKVSIELARVSVRNDTPEVPQALINAVLAARHAEDGDP